MKLEEEDIAALIEIMKEFDMTAGKIRVPVDKLAEVLHLLYLNPSMRDIEKMKREVDPQKHGFFT